MNEIRKSEEHEDSWARCWVLWCIDLFELHSRSVRQMLSLQHPFTDEKNEGVAVVAWLWNVLSRLLCIWAFVSCMVALFWKVMEPLGGRALWKVGSTHHTKDGPIPRSLLCSLCVNEMWSCFFLTARPTSHSCCQAFPHNAGLCALWEYKPKQIFPPQSFFCQGIPSQIEERLIWLFNRLLDSRAIPMCHWTADFRGFYL